MRWPVRVVHQEDERLRVLREVAERDVLAVAAEVGEAERVLVEHAAGNRAGRRDTGCTAAPRRSPCRGRTSRGPR